MAVQIKEQQQYNELPIDSIIHGDALETLRTLPDNCIDAIVCDPPAGISFMNKEFDHNKGGRTQWVSWLAEIMTEARRVLKPGGHALVWSLPRTSHWTALALEDAGFEIRDNIYNIVSGDTALHNFVASLNDEQQHAFMQIIDGQREPSGILQIFGSGFPKSANVSKLIDRMKGMEREVIGEKYISGCSPDREMFGANDRSNGKGMGFRPGNIDITKPATPESEVWDGWGSNLKPAVENWWLVRKPLEASSIAENVLEYGTGGINIDGCRIQGGSIEHHEKPSSGSLGTNGIYGKTNELLNSKQVARLEAGENPRYDKDGRFPSHLLLSHTLFCTQSGTKKVRGDGHKTQNQTIKSSIWGNGVGDIEKTRLNDEDGMETVTNWECDENCPVRILDLQSGLRKSGAGIKSKAGHSIGLLRGEKAYHFQHDGTHCESSEGGASRYFQQLPAIDEVPPYIYASKASRKDRNAGCEAIPEKQGFDKNTSKTIAHVNHNTGETTYNEYHPSSNKNTHPTVKSQALMRYLVRLVTPPNGIVLDMFAGSGSTGVACIHEGFNYILIEKELEYVTIARSRIAHAIKEVQ